MNKIIKDWQKFTVNVKVHFGKKDVGHKKIKKLRDWGRFSG